MWTGGGVGIGSGRRRGEGVLGEAEVLDDLAVDEVLLDDAFGVGGGDVFVPRAFGVDDGDRAVDADAEAVAFGTKAWSAGSGEVKLLEAVFDVFPGGFADVGIDTIGADAEEEMAGEMADAELAGDFFGGDFVGVAHGWVIIARRGGSWHGPRGACR
jgi:hypothetical protein